MQIKDNNLTITVEENGKVDLHYNPCEECNLELYCCEECYGERHIYTTIDLLEKTVNKYKEHKNEN